MRVRECLTLEWPDVRLEPAEGARHGYLTVRRKNAKNSPETMENAVSRMEGWNRARWNGVGTKMGPVTGAENGEKLQIV